MASNYGAIAKSLTQQNVALHAANVAASPDYGKIAEEAIKGRSAERRAAIAAESAVRQTGIKSKTTVEAYQLAAKTKKEVADIKRPAKRFAGVVGAAGTIAGAYMMKKDADAAEQRALDLEAERERRYTDLIGRLNKPGEKPAPLEKPPVYEAPTLLGPDDPVPGATPPTGSPTGGNSGKPDSSSVPSPKSQGAWSFQKVADLATKVGFTPEGAKMISAISGAESKRDPTNSTRRSGLYADTGEDSVGLAQINWGYHKDRGWLHKVGVTKREDLYDPEKNLRAALYLHQQAGKWDDWSVYTSGKYKDWF